MRWLVVMLLASAWQASACASPEPSSSDLPRTHAPLSSYMQSLHTLCSSADRLVITEAAPRGDETSARTLHVVRGRDSVARLLSTLAVNEEASGSSCRCDGDFLFTFAKGEQELAVISYHHRSRLRSRSDGLRWQGDAVLQARSRLAFESCLAELGFAAFSKRDEEELCRDMLEREAVDAAIAMFPDSLHALLRERSLQNNGVARDQTSKDGAQILRAFDDAVECTATCLRALGTLLKANMQFRGMWDSVQASLTALPPATFRAGVVRAIRDDQGRTGAAYVTFACNRYQEFSSDDQWLLAPLGRAALNMEQVLYKHAILRVLAEKRSDATRQVLEEVARGITGIEGLEFGDVGLSLASAASLALARQGDTRVAAHTRFQLQSEKRWRDRAALELSLVLLGFPEFLKAEHFAFRNDSQDVNELQALAFQALESFEGAHGLDLLVNQLITHTDVRVKDEAVRTFYRITELRLKGYYDSTPDVQAIRAWWDEHGEAWVAERRAASER